MATYTGTLNEQGLPTLREEGEVSEPSSTLYGVQRVVQTDGRGNPVPIPDPAEAPGSSEDNPTHVTGAVEITNRPSVRPDLGRFPGGRLPVDVLFPAAPAVVPPLPPIPPAFPDSVELRGEALEWLEALANAIGRRIDASTTTNGRPRAFVVSTTAVRIALASGSRKSIVISNNGGGIVYVGFGDDVTASGITMGTPVPAGGAYSDSGFGMYSGEYWAIYSTSASAENVSVSDRF